MFRNWPEYEELTKIYDIGRELGEGTFGSVNVGVEKSTLTEFAIKTINKRKLIMERQDTENEARICYKLRHPNIVQLCNMIQGETFIYLVFELVTGRELFVDIQDRTFYCEEDASFCMRQILDAINYCHMIGIVHRDLKPENILLAIRGRGAHIKLADFGLAIEVHGDERNYFGSCGTMGYYAPEVLREEKYGKPVDVWACGVILYLLLSGEDPFPDEDENIRGSYGYGKAFNKVSQQAKNLIDQMLCDNQVFKKAVNRAVLISHRSLSAKSAIDSC